MRLGLGRVLGRIKSDYNVGTCEKSDKVVLQTFLKNENTGSFTKN